MVTLLHEEGVQVFVPSNDHVYPPHVHVTYGGCSSRWRLDNLTCTKRLRCSRGDERRIKRFLTAHLAEIKQRWSEEYERRRTMHH